MNFTGRRAPEIGARTDLRCLRLLKEEAVALKAAAEAELVGEELKARLQEIESRTCIG